MAAENQYNSGQSRLRPRANIIRMLGDELISSDTVAVAELVKNAYDADATTVEVRFEGDIDSEEGSVEVADNGIGMTLTTVLSAWMEPATNIKKKRKTTERGRRMLGEKGVGRFAAARLGAKLEMVTRTKNSPSEIVVSFEWDTFGPDGYLDEIECRWAERKPVTIREHGTVLRISGLRNPWTEEEIKELRNALSRIISPFETITDFTVQLSLPEKFRNYAGSIRPSELLKHYHYLIKGKIKRNGEYELHYTSSDRKTSKLTGSFNNHHECGPIHIELRVFDLDRKRIKDLADVFELKPADVRDELKKSSGVYIYRDGFRVLPYGDPNNDWLRLDLRRVQNPTMRVSNNQVVGCILVSADRNPLLKDQTNREGIVASKALNDLKTLVVATLNQLERKRYHERRREKPKQTTRKGIFADFNLQTVRHAVQQKYPGDKALLRVLAAQEKDLSDRVTVVQDVLARYRRLATLGRLVDIFLHEGRTPLNKISSEAELGLNDLQKHKERPSLLDRIRRKLQFIRKQAALLAELFRKMEPFGGRKRGRPARILLESVIADAFELHRGALNKLGVQCELPTSRTQVTLDPAELQQVIFNLLDNSLYWLEQEPPTAKPLIRVQVQRTDTGALQILFCDNGPGILEEDRDHIFEPYFSTKPDGIGLGLSIAGETVAEYDGDLALIEGPLPGACFRIILRRRV